ncbi:MAG TPA: leucyl/phenylalanyl-tRNA--protein transferase [Arenimonas sp.]|uniref:leucyl/phenylalanyl-tRNA--protein transferase n=1 Tax=Arenimonas sp. TaxID=1872635 RepID=UPI002D7E4D5C|nr:leucyl/phenylalanyl-tRNA--protein transferase [Arenimonas sp.]HEU0153556.1 leucyl/phenylalanyl-tRNA--protein transferase [Arenimonas sp.]
MPIRLPLLPADPEAPFPPAARAHPDPNGLLAMGGDLSPTRLLNAYRHGIFPWFSEGDPILWWCPDPRMVFDTAGFRLPSRFRRSLRGSGWQVRADTAFDRVVLACALQPRPGQDGTWITQDMMDAYGALHRLGHAHSVEVYDGRRLVGGIYGVGIGRMFFGESMFSGVSGGSKAALAGLCRILAGAGCPLLDAQVENAHLASLGGQRLPRPDFLAQVARLAAAPAPPGLWAPDRTDFQAARLAGPAGD